MIRVGGLLRGTLVNGPGARYAVFLSGCTHNCKGCHNKPLQDYSYGKDMTASEIVYDIVRHKSVGLIDGVTISGGEPFDQPSELEDLIYELIHSDIKDIWIYSGYTYEQARVISSYVTDNATVLVDGKFDGTLMDEGLKYRGSTNQRIIDLQSTKETGELVLLKYDNVGA